MSVLSMMRNTCKLSTKSESQSTATGGLVPTWVTSANTTQCSIQQGGGNENQQQGREMFSRFYNVYFPAGTQVFNTMRLHDITGPSGLAAGTILEVTSPPVDHAGVGAYVMVTATEVVE